MNEFFKMDTIAEENSESKKKPIAIIGSGDFGRALALRMIQCGYDVYIGSRYPEGHTK